MWSLFSAACLLLPFWWWPLQWTVGEDLPLTTICICSFEAPLGSLISNHVSCQVGIMLGGLLASTGLILSSFATSLEHLYLSLGVLTGRRHSAPLFLPGKQHKNVENNGPSFQEGWSLPHVILLPHCWMEILRVVPFVVKREPARASALSESHTAQMQHPEKATLLLERGLWVKFWNDGRSGRTAVAGDTQKVFLFFFPCDLRGIYCSRSPRLSKNICILKKINLNTRII